MARKLTLRAPVVLLLLVVLSVPAAHAAESAMPKNAAQWCKAWRSGVELSQFGVLYPGGLGYAKTFELKRGNGLAKQNLFGRCVSLTAKKLAAAQAAAAGDASLAARCKTDLAHSGSVYANVGRCVSDRGRQVRP